MGFSRKNSEGYLDLTQYEALKSVAREERQKEEGYTGMKKVFICSRYRADETHIVQEAVSSALSACRYAIQKGFAPIAPHVYIPNCLDDSDPIDRAAGMAIGREFMRMCDEVWQWGKTVTEGMAEELAYAKKLGKPIKVYNTFGIPYDQWNSVQLAKLKESGLFNTMDVSIIDAIENNKEVNF